MARRIDTFEELARLTDAKVFSSPDSIINDSNAYNSYTWAQAWNKKKNLQGGNGIKDFLKVEHDTRGQYINASHVFNPQGRGSTVEHSIGWARFANELAYDDEEIETNEGDRKAKYKSLYKTKRMDMAVDTMDQLEADLWADPIDTMEIGINDTSSQAASVVRVPYSIPALITDSGTSDFTTSTVMGLSPATYSNWQNQYGTWSNFSADIEDLLFDMYHKASWDKPGVGKADSHFTGTPMDGCVIYTHLEAIKSLRRILRDSNDTLAYLGQHDKGLVYIDCPLVRAQPLEPSSNADVEDNWELYGVNWDFLYPVCRQGRFMQLIFDKDGRAFKPHNQPTANIIYEFTDWNLWCKSRRRQWKLKSANAS